MAAREELEITIAPDGRITVVTHGAKGPACLEYAELLQKALGTIESLEHTSEYYERGAPVGTVIRPTRK